MTSYRVLSDEESKNVIRWQAPELGKDAVSVANTRQRAKPQQPDNDVNVRALLGSIDLKPDQSSISSLITEKEGILAGGSSKSADPLHRMSVDTQVVPADLLQASNDDGYKKGYAEGKIAAEQQSVKELRKIMRAVESAALVPVDGQLENELVGMVMDIARFVIQHELSIKPEHIQNIVQAGLDQLPGRSTNQSVMLHPLDAEIVRDSLADNSALSVVDDTSLSRGACHITSGASSLDAGVEDWLKVVAKQLGLVISHDDERSS